ncbi:MAG: Gx transporter family protein [Clostridiales Family XIII bacterium]|jgi:heptaprenyl diphosphate synthase|nr:Gx transporter family protein [Clostridiales Family XIII bacterium]
MSGNGRTRRLVLYALMVALALIFSYVETLLPLPFFVPGMKLGLANIVTVIALYKMKARDAAVISAARILLASLLFGNMFSLAYSLAGGALSFFVMALVKKIGRNGVVGVSVAGGVCHNIAQIGVAAALLETAELVYYLPTLIVSGTVTGCAVGLLCAIIIKKLSGFRLG